MSASIVGSPPDTPVRSSAPDRTALRLSEVRKTFRLPHQRYSTLKERALHPFRSRTFDELRAVDGVTVDIPAGEFFGIVGRNGSGKSTLLKCLAGIYELDGGSIGIDGRLSPFIELGVGFNPDLTARDNVIINATMLGLSRRQARARFDDVIAFAELEEFVDLKLKNYSSGMSVRLAFAVAVQVDADILLVDEVLAVGDAAFQQKCFEQFQYLKDAGKTIVFVTHDMNAVERFCDRAMLVERGRVMDIGPPRRIAQGYNELNFGSLVHDGGEGDAGEGSTVAKQAAADITGCWFENAHGERISAIAQGEKAAVAMEVRFHERIEDPIFGISLRNEPRHTVFATSTVWEDPHTGTFAAGERAIVRIAFDNWLAPSRYDVTPVVARAGAGADTLDLREDMASLLVHATRVTGGIADVPHTIEVIRT